MKGHRKVNNIKPLRDIDGKNNSEKFWKHPNSPERVILQIIESNAKCDPEKKIFILEYSICVHTHFVPYIIVFI